MRCKSGSVAILVGGAPSEPGDAACSGFGRSGSAAGASAARRERPASQAVSSSAEEERRAILEAELQRELALLQGLERDPSASAREAAARSRANVEALRREMARPAGVAAR
jgi:hypothetical protein